jgi:iron-sulfur cluster assembly protein
MNIEPTITFGNSLPKADVMGLTLTKDASQFIKAEIKRRSDTTVGVRFGVEGAGCGGYQYVVEFVDNPHELDYKFVDIWDDVSIFVDRKSILLIDGMEVDYVKKAFESGLTFNNPLAGQACGCGESFSLK